MFDAGLCVHANQLAQAVTVLREEGWHSQFRRSAEWLLSRVRPRRHAFAFARDFEHEIGLRAGVLHGSLAGRTDNRFWASAVPVDIAGIDSLTLARPDLLLHVIADSARTSIRDPMQWIVDAVHVLRSTDDADLAVRLDEAAREYGQVPTVRTALETIGCLLSEPRVKPLIELLD
jgi:hypothetical protein